MLQSCLYSAVEKQETNFNYNLHYVCVEVCVHLHCKHFYINGEDKVLLVDSYVLYM